MSLLTKIAEASSRPAAGTVARGLYELDKQGGPVGKTEMDFVRAFSRNPHAITAMPFGQWLLQWRSGRTNIQSVAVLFDPNHVFVKITSRYRV